MNTSVDYLLSPLNTSTTKQTFSFTRSKRFSINSTINNDRMYTLPSTISHRSCSFGFGHKINIGQRNNSPPPGSYQSPSEFDRKQRYNTISMSIGRQKVKFANFLSMSAEKKNDPSPFAYRIKQSVFSTKGGRMAARLPQQIGSESKKKPGPGTYNLNAIEMKNSGSYILSNYRNNKSPVYHNESMKLPKNTNQTLGPGKYKISDDDLGIKLESRYKNAIKNSFTKQKRKGMADQSKKGFPGFKYKRFSEFGNQ